MGVLLIILIVMYKLGKKPGNRFRQHRRRLYTAVTALSLTVILMGHPATAQNATSPSQASPAIRAISRTDTSLVSIEIPAPGGAPVVSASLARYFDPIQGVTSAELVRRALASNGELVASRLDIKRAHARLRQAGLRPNPTLEVEQSTGRFTGSPDERETSIGVTLPIELGGRRGRRIELARAELEAAGAELADRERRLTWEVLGVYVEALAAFRELEIIEGLKNLDIKTVIVVQARVNEGETAPLELNLLRAEVDRLRSQRSLAEGRLQSALIRLKSIVGIPPAEALRLREDLAAPVLFQQPLTLQASTEIALRTRPDLRLARLNEEVAQAGLRLARAQGKPEMAVSARYTFGRSTTDLPEPLVPVPDRSRSLTFGVSVGLPVFNRNQGEKAEAATAIVQARIRREFAEQVVRSEVASAYARLEATLTALLTYEQGVIARSTDNIRVIRAAYELGEFRITDLIAEQRRLLESQREFTDALTERYRAMTDLQIATGVPITTK